MIDGEEERDSERDTDRQADRETDRQTDREKEKPERLPVPPASVYVPHGHNVHLRLNVQPRLLHGLLVVPALDLLQIQHVQGDLANPDGRGLLARHITLDGHVRAPILPSALQTRQGYRGARFGHRSENRPRELRLLAQ